MAPTHSLHVEQPLAASGTGSTFAAAGEAAGCPRLSLSVCNAQKLHGGRGDASSPSGFCSCDSGKWVTSVRRGQLSWQAFPALCSIGKLVCKEKQMEEPKPQP